jgi:SAM-dependent methyltransferase
MIERIKYESCPLCNDEHAQAELIADCSGHPVWHDKIPKEIKWLRCQHCGHVFTEGYFSEEDYSSVLLMTQDGQKVQVNEHERLIMSRIVERTIRLSRVGSPLTAHSIPWTWLDVGFGSGGLMMTAAEFGYITTGLDLRQDNVKAMESLGGFKAFCTEIENHHVEDDGPYSIISMLDVLEHMPFPRKALTAANKLMNSGGVLIISCPNDSSALWQSMSNSGQNPYWFEIEHYHNFSRERLFMLLQAHGFDPVHMAVSERYRACIEITATKI